MKDEYKISTGNYLKTNFWIRKRKGFKMSININSKNKKIKNLGKINKYYYPNTFISVNHNKIY